MEQNPGDAPLSAQGIEGFVTPVRLHIHSVRKRLVDIDNLSAKAVIDGLVFSKILPDDRPEYVQEITHSQEKGEEEKTIITIEEV